MTWCLGAAAHVSGLYMGCCCEGSWTNQRRDICTSHCINISRVL